jgi:hypothetical protein
VIVCGGVVGPDDDESLQHSSSRADGEDSTRVRILLRFLGAVATMLSMSSPLSTVTANRAVIRKKLQQKKIVSATDRAKSHTIFFAKRRNFFGS